jgi:hypothetical protein
MLRYLRWPKRPTSHLLGYNLNAADLVAWRLQQVFSDATRLCEQDVLNEPKTHVAAVPKVCIQCVIPLTSWAPVVT